MQGAVKASEFYRVMSMEETVEVEKMITAVVVVLVAVVIITRIPYVLNLIKGFWIIGINAIYEYAAIAIVGT